MVNQDSERVTKPIFQRHPHTALQQDIFHKEYFILKDCWAHYLENGTLETFVLFMGAE